MLWLHIDGAQYSQTLASLMLRREQMVGDAVGLTLDAEHWNRVHPVENPIQIELDLKPNVVAHECSG